MLTYMIYFGLLLWCLLLSMCAERSNKKGYMIIIAVLLTVIAGFRGNTVGIDTVSYINKFQMIADGSLEYIYGFEEGFIAICSFLLKLWNNSIFLFVFIAALTNFLIINRIWDLRDISSVPCMVLCYYTQFFFMTMNVMRQFLAIAILFYYSKYLIQKKYFRFILIVLLTSYFVHRSALIGLLFCALELTQWKNLSKLQKYIVGFGTVLAPFVLYCVFMRITKYEHYFQNINLNLGLMIPIKLLFIVGVILQQHGSKIHVRKYQSDIEKRCKYRLSTVKIYYITGLIISLLGYCFDFMDRIGWYFYIFEGCCLGIVLKDKNVKNKRIFIICIIVLLGYGFLDALVGKSQGVIPFNFVGF